MDDTRKTKDLYSISNIISPFAKKILGKRGFVETDILTEWEKIVGKDLAKFSTPLKIDFKKKERSKGTLHIETISGAFALELQHKENFIIEKINTYFGYNAISKLKIVQNINYSETLFDNKEDKKVKKILVTKEEENYINKMTKGLENSKLKDVLIKLGMSISSNNKKENSDDI